MKASLHQLRKLLAICLMLAVVFGTILMSATVFADTKDIDKSGASASLSYTFTGDEKDKAGFAQGTITLKASDSSSTGTYYLYWADNTKALDGYRYISYVSATTSGSNVYMVAHTAIPADATKLIAIKSNTEPTVKTVASATAVYNIPQSKQFTHSSSQKKYSFASFSDIHIANDSYGSGRYPYDEVHLRKALDSAAARNVDFIITSGDNVNNQNGDAENNYVSEYKSYQKVLADSDYCNPIYEAIGNHEMWCTPSKATSAFIKATGLKCDSQSLNSNKAYYAFDEPVSGDHFIMMALETNFYTNKYDEFSPEQISWARGLLDKYKNDGHNTYIVEHANFSKWGVGDDANDPYYDIPLSLDYTGNKALQQILYDYPDAMFFCGHTHIQFSDQFNYMDYDSSVNRKTAKMLHNSSIGGIRKALPTTPHMGNMDRTNRENETEAYIVDCYGDYVICNGANLYYNLINPQTSYIIFGTGNGEVSATKYSVTYNIASSAYLTPDNIERTVTEGSAYKCTLSDNSGKTPSATEAYTKTLTVKMGGVDITSQVVTSSGNDINKSFVINIPKVTGNIVITAKGESTSKALLGDVNLDNIVNVADATLLQKYGASIVQLNDTQLAVADVSGDGRIDVKDATLIQKFSAGIIEKFSVSASGSKDLYSSGASVSDLKTLTEEVENYLSAQYTYSSYDQYMAVKKEYRYCISNINSMSASDIDKHYNDLSSKYKTLQGIAGEAPKPGEMNTIYFKNTYGWSNVYAYVWASGQGNNGWPGEKMTSLGNNIYKISVDQKYVNVIFDNGNSGGTNQTSDLTIPGNNYIYNNSANPQWSPYTG